MGIFSVSNAANVFTKENVIDFSTNLDIYLEIINSLYAAFLP